MFTTHCVFQHRLIQYLVILTVSFLQRRQRTLDRLRWCSAKGMTNKLGQRLEVLTPAQAHLMFFNNRGLTASPIVSLSTQTLSLLNQFLFFSLSRPVSPHPTVSLPEVTWLRSCYLRGYESLFLEGDRAGNLRNTSSSQWISLQNQFYAVMLLGCSEFVVQAHAPW